MDQRSNPAQSTGQSGLAGIVSFGIGGLFFANANEDPQIFVTASFVFVALGLYLIIVGAVAHGIENARR